MNVAQKATATARILRWRRKNKSRFLLAKTRNRAAISGIPFNLDVTDFVIPEYCPVLGLKLEDTTGRSGPGPTSPSLDRIIPALGYVKGNVIVISHKANMIKSNATPDEILKVGLFFEELLKARKEAA